MAYDPNTQAPPAPSVAPISTGQNQNNTGGSIVNTNNGSTTAASVGNQKPTSPVNTKPQTSNVGSGGIGPKPKTEKQKRIEKNKQRWKRIENKVASGTPWKPTPTFVEKDDPRDSTYWANRHALSATLGANLANVANQQTISDVSYRENNELQNEYMRRRKRDIAESRLGSGSVYSGSHRRDQRENTYDYMVDSTRRGRDKQASDNELEFQRNTLTTGYGEDLMGLEEEGAARAMAKYKEESESAAGDSAKMRPRYGRKIKDTNKRITTIRDKMKDASPKEQKRLMDEVRRLQNRRAMLKGKARRDRG